MKKTLSGLVALMMIFTFVFSVSLMTPTFAAEKVKFGEHYYSIHLNSTVKVTMLTESDKPIAIKSIKIKDDTGVIKIEKGNVVKGLKLGYAMIVATATNGSTAETSVNVYEGMVYKFNKLGLYTGETYQVALKSLDQKPIKSVVTWTSMQPEIATVDAQGLITAVAPGTAYISLNNGFESGQFTVGVFDPTDVANKEAFTNVDNLNFSLWNNSNTVEMQTYSVYPMITNSNDSIQMFQVDLKSSNPKVIKVIDKGPEMNSLKTISPGKANITVTLNGVNKVFPVIVKAEPKVKSLTVSKFDQSYQKVDWTRMKIGLQMSLHLQVNYVDGTSKEKFGSFDGVKWKSSNPSIATIDDHGYVTGVKAGKVTFTATYGTKSVQVPFEIVKPH